MRQAFSITALGIALALAGSSPALARTAHHRRPGALWAARYHPAQTARRAATAHRILGNRRTRVFYLSQQPNPLPATRDRIYFLTVDEARAAGYHPGHVPVPPQFTWQGTRHRLPSLGKGPSAPSVPQGTNQPLAPPRAQQPATTPTNPMPND